MYGIQIPSGGCSVYYGSYIDHYANNIRTRYYLNEDHLVASTSNSYTNLPTGSICLSEGELRYKPELNVWFTLAGIVCFLFILIAAIRMLIYPFWRRIR